MAAKLTDEIRDEIASHRGAPTPIFDEASATTFYIITEERLAQLEALARSESESSVTKLRDFIAQGDASADVLETEARTRILQLARNADARKQSVQE